MIIAETDRLILRAWQDSDKEPFAAMNSEPMVMRYLGPPLSRQQSDEAIANQSKLMDKGEPAFWAVERRQDNHFMGCIGVKRCCLLYTSPSPRDATLSRMPSSA